ncbi:MAG: hypothetical protein DCC75_01180, partial [Proteobacteria bacterium]
IRKRVLGIIALVAVRSQALSNAAARLLDDPSSDVRENARLALAYQAEEFPAPALKALGAASATTRQAAARVVSALAGKISISESEKKRAVNAMKEGISKAACPLRATLVAELAVLSKADAEAGILIGCLAAMTDRKQFSDGLVSLERLAPLSEGDAGNFLQTTQNPPLTERLRSAALQASTKLGIRTDLTLPHWEVHLNSSDSAIQEQALLAIGEMGPAANPALDRLRESLGRFDKHSWLGVLTAVTLARIDTTAIDFTRILVSALESENYHLGAKAVSLLPDHLALSVAGQALEKLPTEHTFAAVLSIGLLGDSAKELVPALKSLAIRQDRQLRFHLVLALLRIDPGSLTGSDLLDSVLVGGYYEQLLAAQIPEHALPVIEALAREGKGLLVRRRAQDLALEISR